MGKKTLLILLLLMIFVVLVSCSEDEIPQETTESKSSTVVTTIESLPDLVIDGTPSDLGYVINTNPSEDGITIPSASFVSGTLVAVNDEHAYRYDTASLRSIGSISSSVSTLQEQRLVRLYGKKSQNYLLASAQIFLKDDAFQPWEDLMAAFVADTGKKTVQVVGAYRYSGEESLYSSFVTGYSIAINLYENGANYSLASQEKTVTVNGKTMTCLDWFQDHCVKYGFVYTGLEGSQARTLATFRYVGVPHALAMQRLDYIDTQEYADFLRYYSALHTVTDFENGITWNIDFYPANANDTQTTIQIPQGAVYTVSGDNIGGFVVAYYLPKS